LDKIDFKKPMVDFLELNFLENKITSKQSLCKSLKKIFLNMLRDYEVNTVSSHMLRVHLNFFSALADFGVLDFHSVLRVFSVFSKLFKEILQKLLKANSVSQCQHVEDFSFFYRIEFFGGDNQIRYINTSNRRKTFKSKNETFMFNMAGESSAHQFIQFDEDFHIFKEALKLLLRICEFANFISKIISKMLFILCLFFFKEVYIEDPTKEVY
jgi:hypothetical protein